MKKQLKNILYKFIAYFQLTVKKPKPINKPKLIKYKSKSLFLASGIYF